MGEIFRFEGSGDDLPEELQKLLQGLTRHAMETGLAHDPHEDEVRPSREQLGLVSGDYVAITHTEDKADSEFTIARVVDPEGHAETFPDWEDRLLRSFVLLTWYSRNNQTGRLGWVPRSKLVKCSQSEWEEMMGWIVGNGPGEMAPDWLVSLYNHALAGLAEANPDHMPHLIKCPNCGSPAVLVTLTKTAVENYAMGTSKEEIDKPWSEGPDFHVVTPYHKDYKVTSSMRCVDCDHTEELPDEIGMYG